MERVEAYRGILLADCYHGEVVKKDRIPRALQDRYDLTNLYVEDLPAFWRLLYTIARDGGNHLVIVVGIVDHRTYDKWFPGRGAARQRTLIRPGGGILRSAVNP